MVQEDRADAVAPAHDGRAPDAVPTRRTAIRTIIVVAATGFALHLLLPQVGKLRDTINSLEHAKPGWLVLAAIASAVTYLAASVAQHGAVDRHLLLSRTTIVQLAASFASWLAPGNVGGLGLNVRYLEREGLDRPAAVAAVALRTVAGFAVHALSFMVTLALLGRLGTGDVPHIPRGWPVLVAVLVVLGAIGVALWTPLGRRWLLDPCRRAIKSLIPVLRRPRRAFALFGGSFLLTASYVLALAACCRAFGASVTFLGVAVAYLGSTALAAAAPTPGGLGAIEAAMVAGLTAVGAEAGPAVAAVLAFRLLTFWLPTAPGAVAYTALRRRQEV